MAKVLLYVITFLISIWALECVRFDQIFKKGRVLQIKVLYMMMAFSLSYLTTNFIYDFALFNSFK